MNKNLQQDSAVKPIMLTTQKMKFSVKNLFNVSKSAFLYEQEIFNGKEILNGKVHFCDLTGKVNRQKIAVKKKITLFFEQLCCFFNQNF